MAAFVLLWSLTITTSWCCYRALPWWWEYVFLLKGYPHHNHTNPYGITSPKIPHFIPRLSTRFLTAFFGKQQITSPYIRNREINTTGQTSPWRNACITSCSRDLLWLVVPLLLHSFEDSYTIAHPQTSADLRCAPKSADAKPYALCTILLRNLLHDVTHSSLVGRYYQSLRWNRQYGGVCPAMAI